MTEPQRPSPEPDDVDRAFREIVAGLRGESRRAEEAPPQRPWPAGEPAPDRHASAHEADEPHVPPGPPPPTPIRHLGPGTPFGMATDHRSYEPPEDDDEGHFVPPPTPPLPAGDLHYWAIVIGLVGGPLLLVLSAVVPLLSIGWAAVGTVMTLAGFVLLVLRLPQRRRPFDNDDGAQV